MSASARKPSRSHIGRESVAGREKERQTVVRARVSGGEEEGVGGGGGGGRAREKSVPEHWDGANWLVSLTIETAVPVSSSIHGAHIRANVSGRSIKRKWPGDIPRETDVLARPETAAGFEPAAAAATSFPTLTVQHCPTLSPSNRATTFSSSRIQAALLHSTAKPTAPRRFN